ncbi:MAG: tRNA threonylcarbamoyladenosine dehydratase [Eubacteriales bacterium]|nr:tRNA threonylcarbamoyladenosine dehydratase [Eubacteriales bacterium]
MEHRFSRTELLIGAEGMERLKRAKVAVFGVGGVGGYVAEALARSGIGAFALIDKDRVSLSNINRQIIATEDSIGRKKVEVMKERILSINPEAQVQQYPVFYLPECEEQFPFDQWDYVVDAVDTVTAKIDIVLQAQRRKIPVISSMGAGNKLNPGMFEVADIYQTSVCPLARVMRRELKARGVKRLKVVYSKEKAIKTGASVPGSVAFVPSVAGLMIAGEVIKDLLKESPSRTGLPGDGGRQSPQFEKDGGRTEGRSEKKGGRDGSD